MVSRTSRDLAPVSRDRKRVRRRAAVESEVRDLHVLAILEGARDGGGGEAEAEKLAELNRRYEATFPGLRYVVFVNGRGRDVVMEDMERRIQRGDLALEEVEAIQAMCDIAKDRAAKMTKAA